MLFLYLPLPPQVHLMFIIKATQHLWKPSPCISKCSNCFFPGTFSMLLIISSFVFFLFISHNFSTLTLKIKHLVQKASSFVQAERPFINIS